MWLLWAWEECIVGLSVFSENCDRVSMRQVRMQDSDLDGDMGFAKVANPISKPYMPS